MDKPWQKPVTVFALFNLVAVPLLGRATWAAMLWLNAQQAVLMAVALSVVTALVILAVNAATTVWAVREGVPGGGRSALWVITGLTFVLTIGTGIYSPLSLLHALVTS